MYVAIQYHVVNFRPIGVEVFNLLYSDGWTLSEEENPSMGPEKHEAKLWDRCILGVSAVLHQENMEFTENV